MSHIIQNLKATTTTTTTTATTITSPAAARYSGIKTEATYNFCHTLYINIKTKQKQKSAENETKANQQRNIGKKAN